MKDNGNKTTLTLNEKTKRHLAELGKKGESFDTIIQRVIGTSARLCRKNNNEDPQETQNEESNEEAKE